MTMPLPILDYDSLFAAPDMFDTKESYRAAGFDVRKAEDHNIMVGSHPAAAGYLFKKYSRSVSAADQQTNYETRARGARKLQQFIDEQRLKHIVVPKKWIFDLPARFSRHGQLSRLLIVERMDLLTMEENAARYQAISRDVLDELCSVVWAFRGLDSALHNVCFTRDGKIAFIDTENWRHHRPFFMYHIRRALSSTSRKYADQVYARLKGTASPLFRHSRR